MITLDPGQVAILEGTTPGFVAVLLKLELDAGVVRLSSLPFDWMDTEANLWIGGAGLVEMGESFERLGLEGGRISLTWAGADADLMAAARDNAILGASFTKMIATIGEDGVRVGAPIVDFIGECELPDIDPNPVNPTITLHVENTLIKLRRRHSYRYTPEHHQRFYPGDTFFDFVADLQDKDIFDDGNPSSRRFGSGDG